jgi:phosphoserine phosphatase
MPRATEAFHNRIALVFDFDLTLAPGSLDVLLDKLDVDPEQFREERVHPLDDAGWDHSLARCYALTQLSEERDGAITESLFEEVGRDIELFDGLPEAFGKIRDAAQDIVEDVEVEFNVLTAGYADIVNATPLAKHCANVWGSTFHFTDDGRIDYPKRIVTYPEKVRYLMAYSKNMSVEGHDAPADVWRHVSDQDLHLPLDQMIYVGDGASDLPGFNLMEDHGGLAIGVTKEEQTSDWSQIDKMHEDRRVQNLAEADFSEDAELFQSLVLGVESIAKLVALRKLGKGQ